MHNRNVAWKRRHAVAEEGGVEVLDPAESELPGLYTSAGRVVPLVHLKKVAGTGARSGRVFVVVVGGFWLGRRGRCVVVVRRFRGKNRESRPMVVFGCGLRCLVWLWLVGSRRLAVCVGCEVWPGCDSSCRGRCGAGLCLGWA